MKNFIYKLHNQTTEAHEPEENQETKWQLKILVDSIRYNLYQIEALNGLPVPPDIIQEVAELANIYERLTNKTIE